MGRTRGIRSTSLREGYHGSSCRQYDTHKLRRSFTSSSQDPLPVTNLPNPQLIIDLQENFRLFPDKTVHISPKKSQHGRKFSF